ncbi:MAG: solute carrier family 10 (sodium/bile acid cotransporter), er 7 [Mycobacterium sp.]|nr:solute carrier family 10 (sodium/bile acid cotransporter), er 7 [Mycobacterium sp.]
MFRPRIDPYILLLLTTVGVASVLPARGIVADDCKLATTLAIGLLFFLYGARLSTRAALSGLWHWRLHGLVLAFTFLVFPALGLICRVLVPDVLTPELYAGVMFLCCLPSTVQSSIAFTSIAKGNVAAAICSASFSNLLGIVLTPVLVTASLVTQTGGGVSLVAIRDILLQLLVPFVAGQLLQSWIGRIRCPAQEGAWLCRPRIDPAGGVRGIQRGCSSRDLESTHRPLARDVVHHQRRAPGNCDRVEHDGRTSTAVHDRGSDRDRFLRLEEIASQRIALGQRVFARGDGRVDGRAVDDVPPNAVDGVRLAGPTVRRAPRPGHVATDFTGEQSCANRPRDKCPWSCC